MTKVCYVPKTFSDAHLEIIDHANEIIETYLDSGYTLTLRQLYYQFVARDLLPNEQKQYKRLGGIISDARLAGMIHWEAIEDRTRSLASLSHWDSPEEIVDAVASQFRTDKWADQRFRVEVWIEKEALAGVFARVCKSLDVPYLSCRGYTSQSEMWRASERLNAWRLNGQGVRILHFGDHDPSGIDMTRDIQDRLNVFGCRAEVVRMALNMDQIEQYDPPPNPAKVTDSRAQSYIRRFGHESWELDALEPSVLADLVREGVNEVLDEDLYEEAEQVEQRERQFLQRVSERWSDVVTFLEE